MAAQSPRIVLLENVVGLTHGLFFGELSDILTVLHEMEYIVNLNILDSYEVGGVPQRRRRLYVIAMKSDAIIDGCDGDDVIDHVWPPPITPSPLSSIFDPGPYVGALPTAPHARAKVLELMQSIRHLLVPGGGVPNRTLASRRIARLPIAQDCFGRSGAFTVDHTPCLTSRRAEDGGFWMFQRGRSLSTAEMFRLKGLELADLRTEGVTERTLRSMVGRAFTLPVVGRILLRALPLVGLCPPLIDPWAL